MGLILTYMGLILTYMGLILTYVYETYTDLYGTKTKLHENETDLRIKAYYNNKSQMNKCLFARVRLSSPKPLIRSET